MPPIRYHALLIEQSLHRLKADGIHVTRSDVGHFLLGSLYLGQVVAKAVKLTPDVSALEKSYKHFAAVFSTQRCFRAQKWYELHQGLYCAALMSLKDCKHFQEQFKKQLQDNVLSKNIKNARHRSALHFGLGKQLRLLALHGPTSQVRKDSIELLEKLTKKYTQRRCSIFTVNPDVRDGLLEDLVVIACQGELIEDERREEKEKANKALDELKKFLNDQQKTALAEIISDTKPAPSVIKPSSGSLFEKINKGPSNAETFQKLRTYYTTSSYFIQAPSLFEEQTQDIKELECATLQLHAQLGDEVAAHASDHQSQREPQKELITLDKLFTSRSTQPNGPVHAIKRVLIIGNPGTGKTTLSKQLAYRWAQGEWGKEFKAVYVLPVRHLSKSDYDNGGYRKEATLATAIVNNCFTPPTDEIGYQALRNHIDDQLQHPTTLVILDGMDERAGACEALLTQATAGQHKLLWLSRSYNIEKERFMANIKVELTGLSSEQQRHYVKVKKNLFSENSDSLLTMLANHPNIGEIAHVPVNLTILCTLWRSERGRARIDKELDQGSLPGLYRGVTEYIWERYVVKADKESGEYEKRATKAGLPTSNRRLLFDTLGKIALAALQAGDEIIDNDLVNRQVGEGSSFRHLEVMQDSGFLLLKWLEGSGQYEFPHLTFQEYFAGRWLAKQLFSSDKEEREEAEDFFKENKYDPRYGLMYSFMAGEVVNNKKKRQEGIQKLLTLSNEGVEEDDKKDISHLRLQMRLLNEWLCVCEQSEAEKELSTLEEKFKIRDSLQKQYKQGVDAVRGYELKVY